MARKQVSVYSDGACIGNPGPGGYGIILDHNGRRLEKAAGFRLTTNSRMELLGVIVGLESLREPCDVSVFSDSSYVVDGIAKGWALQARSRGWRNADKKPWANRDLWIRVLSLCNEHQVLFAWVRGHAGHPENERCDELANAAANSSSEAIDEVYEAERNAKQLLV